MAKEKPTKPEDKKKGLNEKDQTPVPESHGILAKHRIKVLKNAGISKSKDHKNTITVVNPTSDLEKGGTEEIGW
jgi:hypothetical protein